MKLKIIYLALASVLVLLSLALGGAASVVQSAGEYSFGAIDQLFRKVNVGPDIDQVEAGTEFSGNYHWHLHINNDNSEAVYEPTISVDSSLDPSFFPNVDEFPATWSLPSLGPWEMWKLFDPDSSYPVTFTLGYDCSRTMDPLEIPTGGGIQTVTIKVKPIDSRYTSQPFMRIDVEGNAIEDSNTQPEGAEVIIYPGDISHPRAIAWEFRWDFTGQPREYTFSVQIQVANLSGVSLVHKPRVGLFVESGEVLGVASGTSTTIHDEILSGDITYSVAASGNWRRSMLNSWEVNFEEIAEYNIVEYDLTIASSEGGSVITPGEGEFTYEDGTLADLKAEPDEGYQFVEWTGDVDTIADVEAASTAITINDDYSIIANFKAVEGCFIATAAYGTPMAEEIQILREFRDKYLLTNPLGQAFVDFYYTVSPPIAEFITEHPSLKPVVRVGLAPVLAISIISVNTTPAEKMAILGSLVLVSMGLVVWAARRRGRGPEYS